MGIYSGTYLQIYVNPAPPSTALGLKLDFSTFTVSASDCWNKNRRLGENDCDYDCCSPSTTMTDLQPSNESRVLIIYSGGTVGMLSGSQGLH